MSNVTKYWTRKGYFEATYPTKIPYAQLHRTDGPAIEWTNGSRGWYQNGQIHRTNGPAIERPDGSRAWYQNGQLHRINGPAIKCADRHIAWYLFGYNVTEEEHKADTAKGELYVKMRYG